MARAHQALTQTAGAPASGGAAPAVSTGIAIGEGAKAIVAAARNAAALAEKTDSHGSGSGSAAVPASGSTAAYADGGGSRQTGAAQDSFYDDMLDSYRKYYDEQVAANNAAADKAAERSRQSADEQRAALNAEYQGVNRQLYRDYKEQERLLPQQMAARGYSGGLTESSRVRLRNGYEEGLGQNERSRIGQEAKINSALAQQEYEAQATADKANAQARQSMYAAQAELRSQKHQQDRADAAQRAAVLAAAGDYSGYRAMGWSEGEIAYLSNMWGAMNPLLQGSQSYGHYSDVGRVKNTAAWQVASYLRKVYGADTAVDYVAEELAAGNIFSDEADALRKYLRNEG